MPPVDKTQIKKERNIKLSIYVNQLWKKKNQFCTCLTD
jgi:hypothetical protein